MKKGIVKVSDLWCETKRFSRLESENNKTTFVRSFLQVSICQDSIQNDFQSLPETKNLLTSITCSSCLNFHRESKRKKKGSSNWVTSSVQAKKLSLLIRLLKYNFYNYFVIPF
jgi:hypothetical protein